MFDQHHRQRANSLIVLEKKQQELPPATRRMRKDSGIGMVLDPKIHKISVHESVAHGFQEVRARRRVGRVHAVEHLRGHRTPTSARRAQVSRPMLLVRGRGGRRRTPSASPSSAAACSSRTWSTARATRRRTPSRWRWRYLHMYLLDVVESFSQRVDAVGARRGSALLVRH